MAAGNFMKTKILNRIDTEENWLSCNPVLSSAEIVFSKTSAGTFMKLGDGRPYSETPFYQDIKIDDKQVSSLHFERVSYDKYANYLISGLVDSNTIYIISSDNINVFGEQIKNLAPGTEISDAVTYGQLTSANEDIKDYVDQKVSNIDMPIYYGTCSTAQGTATKQVICNNLVSAVAGTVLFVKFSNVNTSTTPSLSVSGLNATKRIYRYGTTNPVSYTWYANQIVSFTYDGNYWLMNYPGPANTTNDGTVKLLTAAVTGTGTGGAATNSTVYNTLTAQVYPTAFSTTIQYYADDVILYSGNLYYCKQNYKGSWSTTYFSRLTLGNLLNIYNSKIRALSSEISSIAVPEIKIDDSQVSSFEMKHVGEQQYGSLLANGNVKQNCLYVVSSDIMDMYGESITNLGEGTELSDALPKWQIDRDYVSKTSLSSVLDWSSGSGTDSIVQKQSSTIPVVTGSSNTAVSQGAFAAGVATYAGLKGYRYTNTGSVTNSLTFETVPTGWEVGDVVSIVNVSKHPDCATIDSILGNTVTFSENLPFSQISDDSDWDSKLAYVSAKPDKGNIDIGYGAHTEGVGTNALNAMTHAEGRETKALGQYAHAEGRETRAQYAAHAEGYGTQATEEQAHSEGYYTTASGKHSHAEGCRTKATNTCAHSEGENTTASGNQSHSEGYNTTASASQTHAEGNNTKATANQAHAEGNSTTASGTQSHAEGFNTTSDGGHSHSEGSWTNAGGNFSHAEGRYTKTQNASEHSQGQYNKSNKASTAFGNSGNTIHSIGIGTSESKRKNAVEVMQDGKVFVKDIGGYDGTNPTGQTNAAQDLATVVNGKFDRSEAISVLGDIESILNSL